MKIKISDFILSGSIEGFYLSEQDEIRRYGMTNIVSLPFNLTDIAPLPTYDELRSIILAAYPELAARKLMINFQPTQSLTNITPAIGLHNIIAGVGKTVNYFYNYAGVLPEKSIRKEQHKIADSNIIVEME